MPFSIPTLDDRTYRDLLEEGFRLVASGDGEWTNRNPSDPGVTLLELLAYVSELLMYRAAQLTDKDLRAFARLLAPGGGGPDASATDQLSEAVASARRRERVVSREDFENAAMSIDPLIVQARVVPDRDLTRGTAVTRRAVRPGHVTVLIVPRRPMDDQALETLCGAVLAYLEPRRLLTTRVHVAAPASVDVGVRAAVTISPGSSANTVRRLIGNALTRFFDPATGGADEHGWPVGRSVFVSELYHLLGHVPGVEYVTRIVSSEAGVAQDELVVADAARLQRNDAGELVAARLEAHEIVRHDPGADVLRLRSRHDMLSGGDED